MKYGRQATSTFTATAHASGSGKLQLSLQFFEKTIHNNNNRRFGAPTDKMAANDEHAMAQVLISTSSSRHSVAAHCLPRHSVCVSSSARWRQAKWAAVSRMLHHHVKTIVGGGNHGKPDLAGLQAQLLGKKGTK
jgi:hypothetical protein